MSAKFSLGNLLVTTNVDARMRYDIPFRKFIKESLEKYEQCDWGDTCSEDRITNENALKNNERILAVYIYKNTDTKIWIITEWDRSVTTILFPEEY